MPIKKMHKMTEASGEGNASSRNENWKRNIDTSLAHGMVFCKES